MTQQPCSNRTRPDDPPDRDEKLWPKGPRSNPMARPNNKRTPELKLCYSVEGLIGAGIGSKPRTRMPRQRTGKGPGGIQTP